MTYLFSCNSGVKAWELQRIFGDRGPSLRSESCVPRLRYLVRIASTKLFFRGVRSSLITTIPEPRAYPSPARLPSSQYLGLAFNHITDRCWRHTLTSTACQFWTTHLSCLSVLSALPSTPASYGVQFWSFFLF